jgi:hypothetical protein
VTNGDTMFDTLNIIYGIFTIFLKTRSRLKGQIPFVLIFIQASTQVCNAIEMIKLFKFFEVQVTDNSSIEISYWLHVTGY